MERLDSAGFSLPYSQEDFELLYSLNSKRDLQSFRYSRFVQKYYYTKQYSSTREIRITGGIRQNTGNKS
jgi:hypothetical protein